MGVGYKTEECGGFHEVTQTTSAVRGIELTSPRRCIWVLQAPEHHCIDLNIIFRAEENHDGSCQFIEVRELGVESGVVFSARCSHINKRITSQQRWFYITYVNMGHHSPQDSLLFTFSIIPNCTVKPAKDPTTCASYEYVCENKVCISYSYRCDNFNDCGCPENASCDEKDCFAHIKMEPTIMLIVSVSLGSALMVLVVVAGTVMEKHHNWEHISAKTVIVPGSLKAQVGAGLPRRTESGRKKTVFTPKGPSEPSHGSGSVRKITETHVGIRAVSKV